MLVKKENPFSCVKNAFAIGPSAEGYTLNYSLDGETWTAYEEETPSGVTAIVNFGIPNLKYKLVGNNSDVLIQY